jgi:hypothetical protein
VHGIIAGRRVEMSGISFIDIEDAFLFVNSAPYGTNSAYLNVETGQILYQSEIAGIDEIGDEKVDWDQTIEIPHENDLDLGQSIVFEFVEINLPDEHNRVREMFGELGADSLFKTFLGIKGLLGAWYRFEHERKQKALRSWCKESQILVSD